MRFKVGRIASLGLLVLSEVAAMSTWFATNASIGAIKSHWQLSEFHESLLTLPDRVDLRRLFEWSAFVAGGSTFSVILFEPTSSYVPILRFATGFSLGGVYPVGMAIASTWASGNLGLLMGLLVAALTLGSAVPHLVAATAGLDWRVPCVVASLAALVAGAAIRYVDLGPSEWKAPKFKLSNLLEALNKRSGWPTLDTSVTCGNFMPCGLGSARLSPQAWTSAMGTVRQSMRRSPRFVSSVRGPAALS
jgi:MFS family permease